MAERTDTRQLDEIWRAAAAKWKGPQADAFRNQYINAIREQLEDFVQVNRQCEDAVRELSSAMAAISQSIQEE